MLDLDKTRRMLLSDEFWQNAAFGAIIGGIITLLLMKLWDKDGGLLGNTRNTPVRKRPTEHDERF